jgi:hypothetical protein
VTQNSSVSPSSGSESVNCQLSTNERQLVVVVMLLTTNCQAQQSRRTSHRNNGKRWHNRVSAEYVKVSDMHRQSVLPLSPHPYSHSLPFPSLPFPSLPCPSLPANLNHVHPPPYQSQHHANNRAHFMSSPSLNRYAHMPAPSMSMFML